jgi:hypothetical protein
MNIDISLIDKCLPNRRQIRTKPQKNNIVKQNTFFLQNELIISETVRKIRYHKIWFDLIQKHTLLKICEMDDRALYQHEVILSQEMPKYVLCEYPVDRRIDFWEFMTNIPTEKLAIFHLFDSFHSLLNSLELLNQKGLRFYGIGPDNIAFGEDLKPILRNFDNCFFAEQTHNFVANTHNSEYKPQEFHVLQYLARNKCASVSSSVICEFGDCEYLKPLINNPISVVNSELMSRAESWDKCSLSLVYLQLIEVLLEVFSLKYKFMNEFIDLLNRISCPDQTVRMSDTAVIRMHLDAIRIDDFSSFS